ncbi:MAG: hypothetical protein HQ564_10480 [Candidatus Saganbacteria bacterium]|nr:hypothetical protein [Candidatus Saganbacteria bacterium]
MKISFKTSLPFQTLQQAFRRKTLFGSAATNYGGNSLGITPPSSTWLDRQLVEKGTDGYKIFSSALALSEHGLDPEKENISFGLTLHLFQVAALSLKILAEQEVVVDHAVCLSCDTTTWKDYVSGGKLSHVEVGAEGIEINGEVEVGSVKIDGDSCSKKPPRIISPTVLNIMVEQKMRAYLSTVFAEGRWKFGTLSLSTELLWRLFPSRKTMTFHDASAPNYWALG